MKKVLKIAGVVLGIVILLIIVTTILLITLVNPDRFKPLITQKVKQYTGRDLTIDGHLSWTIFPTLGIKVGHLTLNNPPEFDQKIFAEIESTTVSVRLMPLLRSKIESSGLSLKGLKLNLIKNSKGITNWKDLESAPAGAATEITTQPAKTSEQPQSSYLGLAIAGVDITNASIHWINEQSKQYIDVEKLELHAKDISLTEPFDIKMSFNLDGKNPAISGRVSLASKMSLNLEKKVYRLHPVDLNAKLHQDGKKMEINFKGDLSIDLLRDKLQLDNLDAQLANLNLKGKVNVADLTSHPKTTGHFRIKPFDVKTWLQTTGQDIAALQSLKNLTGDFDFSAGTTLQSVNLQGIVKINEIKTSKVSLTDINVNANMQNGILNLSSMTAKFYQGMLNGQSQINLNNSVPQIALQAKAVNIQAEPLLSDLIGNGKLKFTGTGNVNLQVMTKGANADTLLKNLNGNSNIIFNNGVIHGIDIGYLLDSAYSIARRQSLPTTNTEQTPFGSLTASAVIQNGVILNNDFYLNSPQFDSRGNGSVDLVNQMINFRLATSKKQTEINQKNNLNNMYGIGIPIIVKGPLNKPNIFLDTEGLMKAIADQQLKKAKIQIDEKLQKQIQDNIPENAKEFLNKFLGR